MTLTLNLKPEIEQSLAKQAQERGLSTEAYTLQLLEEWIEVEQKRLESVKRLQSWIDDGDAEEQQETGEYLINALDEERLSDRPFFPVELKGKTW
ncbi:MAG: hypothetical protein SWY16_27020 [Cyanobacteriota bacterium]|nr:hypothetical protein [Cyanobacteriota bacterium]